MRSDLRELAKWICLREAMIAVRIAIARAGGEGIEAAGPARHHLTGKEPQKILTKGEDS